MAMPFRRRTLVLVIAAVVLLPPLVWWGLYEAGLAPAPGEKLHPTLELSDRLVYLVIEEDADGDLEVVFEGSEKREIPRTSYSAENFLKEVKARQPEMDGAKRSLYRVFNITSLTGVLWVVFGFLGQALFMGRMLVQWWASEKAKSAVVPTSFWWLSLIGSSMLMTYFIWRVEIVGFLGQSTGWAIYIRNLWFIHGGKKAEG